MTARERRRQQLLWMMRLWTRHRGAWFIFALVFSLSWAAFAAEAPAAPGAPKQAVKAKFELPVVDPADENAPGKVLRVEGTVSARNKFGLAVAHGVDKELGELEAWLEYNKKTKFGGDYKKFSDIQEGDTVTVQFKQLDKTHKKILQQVTLVKKKPKEKPQKDDEGDGALVSSAVKA